MAQSTTHYLLRLIKTAIRADMTASSYLLLLETSTIIQTDLHTWQAIAKLGECFLPEVVALEIKNIANGKADGNETVAKSFQNSMSQLDWQITSLTANHPDLVLNTSQNLSRKAKLILNVAQSSIGVANAHPQKCVVLVSDEISLRDRIAKLNCKNLCAIPSAIARQWSRTNQAPPIVQLLIKQLPIPTDQTTLQSFHQSDNKVLNSKSLDISTTLDKSSHSSNQKSNPNLRHISISLMKFGIITTFLVTILLFGWRLVQPQQFQQFWKKTGLPPLPKILIDPSQPKKP
ncbi:MAG: hypothetical protein DCF19_09155 [Pseudanabaena frigida]|uniref:PIN domain-containing protein n=1 Tax=Pseudanabaena frigida TaxID=945775 RepID=A0A2W4Y3Y2_9CYAN|nr:MAG: hypothetical protein DCF19_09155 [Pseudanabaena frigida]